MQSKDLRIGNLVYDAIENIHQISSINGVDLGLLGCSIELRFAKSIPLTEERLLEFGFNKVGSNFENGLIIIHTNNKTGTFDFLLNEPHSSKLIVRILQHVHQLQNLYFALTGEELEFKKRI